MKNNVKRYTIDFKLFATFGLDCGIGTATAANTVNAESFVATCFAMRLLSPCSTAFTSQSTSDSYKAIYSSTGMASVSGFDSRHGSFATSS